MPQKRAPRGEGTRPKWDEKRGAWVARVPVGKYPNGKTRYQHIQAPTQGEVVRRKRGVTPAGPSETVANWSKRWLAGFSAARPGTRKNAESAVRVHINPALGGRQLSAVRPSDAEAFARHLAEKGLETSTVRKVLNTASALFNAAVRDELVSRNPFAAARRPKSVPRDIDPLTPAELRAVVGAWRDLTAGPTIALLAATGCRLGEAAALDVTDYDGERVSITKTWSRKDGAGPPKSRSGMRTIRVPVAARAALDHARGDRVRGPLFATAGGRRFGGSAVLKAFHLTCRKLGIRERNPHQLRHSFCSHAIARGYPVADVAQYVGDVPGTIFRTYCHPVGRDPSLGMDELFGG